MRLNVRLKGAAGFTLIELMIVILIIAILVAIAVPVYLNARANAQRRTCQSNLRTVDGAVQSYQAFYGDPVYPTQLSDMAQPGSRCLKTVPMCPVGPTAYAWIADEPPHISCASGVANHII